MSDLYNPIKDHMTSWENVASYPLHKALFVTGAVYPYLLRISLVLLVLWLLIAFPLEETVWFTLVNACGSVHAVEPALETTFRGLPLVPLHRIASSWGSMSQVMDEHGTPAFPKLAALSYGVRSKKMQNHLSRAKNKIRYIKIWFLIIFTFIISGWLYKKNPEINFERWTKLCI